MNKKAFSLIEVLVSLLILLVGIMGLAMAFQRQIFQTNSAKNDSQAMMIAVGILDELQSRTFDEIISDLDLVEDEFLYDYYGNQVASEDDAYYIGKVAILREIGNMLEIEVQVNWTGWSDELATGGFGRETASHAFTLSGIVAQQYGDDVLAGTPGS